jgi:hypothetical protein
MFLGEEHGQLPCLHNLAFTGLGVKVLDANIEEITDYLLNVVD